MNGKTNASDITINQIVNGVLIPLEPATDFKIGSGSGRAYFTWIDPVDKYTTPGDELVSQWEKSVVVRKKDSAPSNIDDGTVVLTETTRNQYSENSYSDEGLENNTNYFYSVYPVNHLGVPSDPIGGSAYPIGGDLYFKTYLENPFGLSGSGWKVQGAATTRTNIHYICRNARTQLNVAYRINSDYTAAQTKTIGDGSASHGSELSDEYVVFTRIANTHTHLWTIDTDSTVIEFIDNDPDMSFNYADGDTGINYDEYLAMVKTTYNDTFRLSILDSDLTISEPDSPVIPSPASRNIMYRAKIKNFGIWGSDKFTACMSDDLTVIGITKMELSQSDYISASKVDKYVIFTGNNVSDNSIYSQGYDADLTYYSSDTIPAFPMIDNSSTMVCGRDMCPSDKQIGSYGVVPLAYNLIYASNPSGGDVALGYIDADLVVSEKKLSDIWQNNTVKHMDQFAIITKFGTDAIMYFSTMSATEPPCAVIFSTI